MFDRFGFQQFVNDRADGFQDRADEIRGALCKVNDPAQHFDLSGHDRIAALASTAAEFIETTTRAEIYAMARRRITALYQAGPADVAADLRTWVRDEMIAAHERSRDGKLSTIYFAWMSTLADINVELVRRGA